MPDFTVQPQANGWSIVASVTSASLNAGTVNVDTALPTVNNRSPAGMAIALVPLTAAGAPDTPAGTFDATVSAYIPTEGGDALVEVGAASTVAAGEAATVADLPVVQSRLRLALSGTTLAGTTTLVCVAPVG